MKTIINLLVIVSLTLLMTSCSSDDAATVNNQLHLDIPAWLQAEWMSVEYPEDDHSYIDDSTFHLNFSSFGYGAHYFGIDDVDVSSASVDEFTINYADNQRITFYDLSNTTDIIIIISDNDVLHELGRFKQVND